MSLSPDPKRAGTTTLLFILWLPSVFQVDLGVAACGHRRHCPGPLIESATDTWLRSPVSLELPPLSTKEATASQNPSQALLQTHVCPSHQEQIVLQMQEVIWLLPGGRSLCGKAPASSPRSSLPGTRHHSKWTESIELLLLFK